MPPCAALSPRRGRQARKVRNPRGGLTDLDFIPKTLMLPHPKKIALGPGASTPQVIERANEVGLLAAGDSRVRLDPHHIMSDIFQWQRLMVEGKFHVGILSKAILQRLATVSGLPTAAAMQAHVTQSRTKIVQIYPKIFRTS